MIENQEDPLFPWGEGPLWDRLRGCPAGVVRAMNAEYTAKLVATERDIRCRTVRIAIAQSAVNDCLLHVLAGL
jgi:hypothetical protein